MMLDYNSLLIALGASTFCLAVTLLGSWLNRRPETFLLTCAIGLLLVVAAISCYSFYIVKPMKSLAVVSFTIALSGFSVIWAAGYQFRKDRLSRVRIVAGAVLGLAISVPPMLLGYDGLAFIVYNLVIAAMLSATAYEYWLGRAEAPAPIYGITTLYLLTAFTFVLCSAVLISDGKMVIGKAPQNWAENLSIAVAIAAMTGIGALSLALHQWRQATRHRSDAMTDQLTGLMNRRALFDRCGNRSFSTVMAAVIFDIDRFKAVNDEFGHAAGDAVLKLFAEELVTNLRAYDVVARLGGEEFTLVLDNVMPGRAEQIADRIRECFAARSFSFEGKTVKCTVSAGIAFGSNGGADFEGVLQAADRALYAAKRNGRNRVETAEYLHVVASDTEPPPETESASA
ncbi:GGDEF domain-containing protein [Rhizobium tumorigenes]|uniref:diguanylate cyclase n=1 Tax=Rhizobium tumorigenes TaxID=2041385 RepID=A0AAF1KW24_9HYPH|nr:GGDEF domain-containing protein [Rhizobium tumorigenes]WFR95664.1 GGDEF domain-containing protein [Rhizobium tumorigenes]